MRILAPCLLCLSLLLGCEAADLALKQTDSQTTNTELQQEVNEAVTAAKEYAVEKKGEFAANFKEHMESLDAKIEKLEKQAADLKEDASEKAKQRLAELKEKRKAAGEKFEAVTSASDEAWQEMKGGFETAWNELQKAYEDAEKELE